MLSGNKDRDISTCGVLHSIGSDLTRMKVISGMNQNGSTRSEQTITKRKELGSTPTSMVKVSVVMNQNLYVSASNLFKGNNQFSLELFAASSFKRKFCTWK